MNRFVISLNMIFCLFVTISRAQDVYNMGTQGTISTCSAIFYDSGGRYGSPVSNDYTLTFRSANQSALCVKFTSFYLDEYSDTLYIYNGDSITSPLIGAYTGNVVIPDIVSSNTLNCITFQYKQHPGFDREGWKAKIECGAITSIPQGIHLPCEYAFWFCSDTTYSIPSTINKIAETGPDYGCLLSKRNPIWVFFKIDEPGELDISIKNTEDEDIDFVLWGPYNTPNMCDKLTGDKVKDCSYSDATSEHLDIYSAQHGQYYAACVTSFSMFPTNVLITTNNSSTATTDCNDNCVLDLTAAITSCNEEDSITNIKCKVWKRAYTNSGNLVIKSSIGTTNTFSPPFTKDTEYELFDFPIGSSVKLTAYYTNDSTCIDTVVIPTSISNLNAVGYGQNVLQTGDENGTGLVLPNGGFPPYVYHWSNGANTQSVYGLSEATYYVTVTDARNCEAVSSIFIGYGTQTSISNEPEKIAFQIMPNPVSDELRLEFDTPFTGEGLVLGIDGKLFKSFVINSKVARLYMADTPAGVYLIGIKNMDTNIILYAKVVKY